VGLSFHDLIDESGLVNFDVFDAILKFKVEREVEGWAKQFGADEAEGRRCKIEGDQHRLLMETTFSILRDRHDAKAVAALPADERQARTIELEIYKIDNGYRVAHPELLREERASLTGRLDLIRSRQERFPHFRHAAE
jgi:hypothetical protein